MGFVKGSGNYIYLFTGFVYGRITDFKLVESLVENQEGEMRPEGSDVYIDDTYHITWPMSYNPDLERFKVWDHFMTGWEINADKEKGSIAILGWDEDGTFHVWNPADKEDRQKAVDYGLDVDELEKQWKAK